MLQIVDVPGESESPEAAELGLVLPALTASGNSVVLEDRDGSQIRILPAAGLVLIYRGQEVMSFPGIEARVWLTDARLAVLCSHYDKGGGWLGDPISMGIFNAVSKVRASIRSRGKALVGQARYPWVARVGSVRRSGVGSLERLVIDASETDEDTYRLVISLPKSIQTATLAAEIVRRASAYRLASENDLDDDERRALQHCQLATSIQPSPSRPKGHIYFHEMPSCWRISEKSARYSPSRYPAP